MSNSPSSVASPAPRTTRIRWITALVLLTGAGAIVVVAATPPSPRKVVPAPPPPAPRFPVEVRQPAGPPTVRGPGADPQGKPAAIACGVCHATRPPNANNRLAEDLDEFHQGMKVRHGNLSCVSCHNPSDGYQSLRLADGRSVSFADVMQLCAQCHGPQYRDYQHGAHGGMRGFWDLKKGPRQRNNCIDCHDPHTPRYPTVSPAPGPRDRFLDSNGHTERHP